MGMSRAGIFLGLALLACRVQGREESFRLPNGLTVLVRPVAGAAQAAVAVLYSVGSDHDPEGRSGMGHLLEHLYVTSAAGTARARTADEYFAAYPAGANAQTGEKYTVIASVVPKASLEAELKDAAARMGDLRIGAADLDRERPRLLEELENMFGGIPELGARNLAAGAVRPPPRGGRKGGLPAHLAAMTVEELTERWKKHYKPANAILVVAGGCEAGAVKAMVSRHFEAIPAGEPAGAPASPGRPRLGTVEKASGNGRAAAVAYAAPDPGSDLYPAFLVLVARLWGKGRETYPVLFAPLDDPSTLSVGVRPGAGETDEAALARLDAFVAGAVGPPLRGDDAAGTLNAFGFLLGLSDVPDAALAQNPYGVAFSLGRRRQLGLDPALLRESIRNVKEGDLCRARDLFSPARRAAALVSPR